MRQNQFIVILILSAFFWLALINYLAVKNSNERYYQKKLEEDVKEFEEALRTHGQVSHGILKDIKTIASNRSSVAHDRAPSTKQDEPRIAEEDVEIPHTDDAIAVLVISCNRVTVARSLDQLIRYRPSKSRFPIIVSQDCVHEPTSRVIRSYQEYVYHVRQPDQSEIFVPPKEKKFKGYFKIARHYKWALQRAFDHYGFNTVVIVEDDLDVSPDFYEYFAATLPVLRADESLWCVSAWNDNGKLDFVDANAVDLLYRTDFFPGLGWMLTKSLWRELVDKWPVSYWDDWMREPAQRRNRSCIRPELSRTRTFGKIGVSNGLFYEKHLKYIYLNNKVAEFTKQDVTYLAKEAYDDSFLGVVYASPIVSLEELKTGRLYTQGSVRILYDTRQMLKKITKSIGLMDDFKSGVPRTAYMGIISFMYKGRRVFITPNSAFRGYEAF